MHDARSIANFFLNRAREQQLPITIMTLLKVVFFSHAWYLAKHGVPLVAQPFEAWKYGPVSRVVYDQYKDLGDRPIAHLATKIDVATAKFVPAEFSFEHDLSEFLSNMFDYYARFSPFHLSDLTHKVGGPWHQVWEEAGRRAVPGMKIPNEAILAWFRDKQSLFI
jgi:uncharacterized phage-associated protein